MVKTNLSKLLTWNENALISIFLSKLSIGIVSQPIAKMKPCGEGL